MLFILLFFCKLSSEYHQCLTVLHGIFAAVCELSKNQKIARRGIVRGLKGTEVRRGVYPTRPVRCLTVALLIVFLKIIDITVSETWRPSRADN